MEEEVTEVEGMVLEVMVLAIQEADLEAEVVQIELLSPKSAFTTRSEVTLSSHVGN